MTSTTDKTEHLVAVLNRFIRQRPGFDRADYMGYDSALRSDMRAASKYRQPALDQLERLSTETGEDICWPAVVKTNHYNRVRVLMDGDHLAVEYTAGQYMPTEYRYGAYRWIRDYIDYARRYNAGERWS